MNTPPMQDIGLQKPSGDEKIGLSIYLKSAGSVAFNSPLTAHNGHRILFDAWLQTNAPDAVVHLNSGPFVILEIPAGVAERIQGMSAAEREEIGIDRSEVIPK
jgi:hypothetical protein